MGRSVREAWKFTAVERKIMRCVAEGETAKFERDEIGQRPVVSGAFLAELWLERIEGAHLHPLGIHIDGLAVDGPIVLGGVRVSARGRDGLVGFMAEDCEFRGLVNLNNSLIETTGFIRCTFHNWWDDPDHTGFASINFASTNVRGSVGFIECETAGVVYGPQALIEGEFQVDKSRIDGGVSLAGSRISNSLVITNSEVKAHVGNVALTLNHGEIGDLVRIENTRVAGPLFAADIKATALIIRKSRIGCAADHGLSIARAQLAGGCELTQVRARGWCGVTASQIGGDLRLDSCVFGRQLLIEHNAISGPLSLQRVKAGENSTGLYGLGCEMNTASNFFMTKSKIVGSSRFGRMTVSGAFRIAECRFGRRTLDVSKLDDAGNSIAAPGLRAFKVELSDCVLNCHTGFREMDCEGSAHFARCFFNGNDQSFALDLQSGRVKNLLTFDSCFFSAAVRMPLVSASEVQFKGTIVHCGERASIAEGHSVWASDCTISRRFSIDKSGTSGTGQRRSCFTGQIELGSSTIGEDFVLRAADLFHPDHSSEADATILSLRRAKIGGSVVIGVSPSSQDAGSAGVFAEGCLDLGNARIEGGVFPGRVRQSAVGRIERPLAHSETEKRVSGRKRGVALYLRGATLGGSLQLDGPRLEGLVDLRDATIDRIGDGGGERWMKAGIEPGHLLLDGMAYRDLDDIHDQDPGGSPQRQRQRQRGDPVTRRLQWLELQFPDRRPSLETFVPQPYEQLARFFAGEGNERARRRVQIARRDLQRRHGGLKFFERLVQRFLKLVSQYGYDPGRAILTTLAYLAFGTGIAAWMDATGALMLASVDTPPDFAFNPLVFAIDAAIPIIDLNQDGMWALDPDAFRYDAAMWALSTAKSLYEIVGMLVVSITILTLTGTLREKD